MKYDLSAPFFLACALLLPMAACSEPQPDSRAGTLIGQATTPSDSGGTNGSPAPPPNAPDESSALSDWDASDCGDDHYQNAQLQRHPELVGLPLKPLLAAFGQPFEDEDFVIGEPQGTFYGDYAKSAVDAASPLRGRAAKVVTWQKSGCNFSAFLVSQAGEFRVTRAFEWAVGADF